MHGVSSAVNSPESPAPLTSTEYQAVIFDFAKGASVYMCNDRSVIAHRKAKKRPAVYEIPRIQPQTT